MDRHEQHQDHISRALATEGGHLAIGRGGATLYFENGWMSGAEPEALKTAAIGAGLPVIDSRRVPFDVVYALAVCGPIEAYGRAPDPEPWGPLSYAPLRTVAEAYRRAGAEVWNVLESASVCGVAPGVAEPEQPWTVQCAYAGYFANTATVEAESAEEACRQAIELANTADGWRSLDHCGATFVDALAPGGVHPWILSGSVEPVPARFSEQGVLQVTERSGTEEERGGGGAKP